MKNKKKKNCVRPNSNKRLNRLCAFFSFSYFVLLVTSETCCVLDSGHKGLLVAHEAVLHSR